jgi:sarcosine oxidase, subunit gamma
MVDAQPQSALTDALISGQYGADGAPGDSSGITLSEVRGQTLVHIAGDSADSGFADGIMSATGLRLPTQSGQITIGDDKRICWLGPDQWLLKTSAAPYGEWQQRLAEAAPSGAFNDVSFARTTLRLTGPNVRDVLAKGCPLDLHPAVFTPDRCAQTLLGHLNPLIECLAADVFEVSVTRSYGVDLFEWVCTSAAEYGYQVDN